MTARSKYAPLGKYLREHKDGSAIPLTFSDIERLIGCALPASKRYPAWWSNNPLNNPMTKIWLAAGFETEQVDTKRETVVFRHVAKVRGERAVAFSEAGLDRKSPVAEDEPREFRHAEGKALTQHPLIGAMKGTFTIEPGWDLTKPSLDPDELAEWEANIERKANLIDEGMNGKKSR